MKQIVSNVFKILDKHERLKFLYIFLFNTVVSVLDIASIVILLFALNFYSSGKTSNIFNFNWLSNNYELFTLFLFLIFVTIKNLLGILASKFQYTFVYSVAVRISKAKLIDFFEEKFENIVQTDSSKFLRKISHHPIEFSQHILAGMQQILTEAILVTISFIAILVFNAQISLVLCVLLLPPILLIVFISKKRLKVARDNIDTSNEKVIQFTNEALKGYVEINLYNGKKYFIERFIKAQEKICQYLPEILISQNFSTRLMEIFAVLGLFLLFLANKILTLDNTNMILNIGAFMGAAYKIIPGVMRILNIGSQIRTFGFTSADVKESNTPIPTKDLEKITTISFEKVSFYYLNRNILNSFDLSLRSGDFVGISAPSGTGKTTLVNLLLGFIEEQSGTISINGIAKNAGQRRQFWPNISYIKQQTFLIHDTIQNNICFGDHDLDQSKYMDSIKASGLFDFVNGLPNKSHQFISENGKNISGGQQQRLAIARAIYKNSDVYILDEPFNELDESSEKELIRYFKKIANKGAIVILICHNPESLSQCTKTLTF